MLMYKLVSILFAMSKIPKCRDILVAKPIDAEHLLTHVANHHVPSDLRLKANCSRTIKSLTSQDSESAGIEEGEVTALITTSLQGKINDSADTSSPEKINEHALQDMATVFKPITYEFFNNSTTSKSSKTTETTKPDTDNNSTNAVSNNMFTPVFWYTKKELYTGGSAGKGPQPPTPEQLVENEAKPTSDIGGGNALNSDDMVPGEPISTKALSSSSLLLSGNQSVLTHSKISYVKMTIPNDIAERFSLPDYEYKYLESTKSKDDDTPEAADNDYDKTIDTSGLDMTNHSMDNVASTSITNVNASSNDASLKESNKSEKKVSINNTSVNQSVDYNDDTFVSETSIINEIKNNMSILAANNTTSTKTTNVSVNESTNYDDTFVSETSTSIMQKSTINNENIIASLDGEEEVTNEIAKELAKSLGLY